MYYDVDRDFKDDEKLPLGRACENSEIILITDEDKEAQEGEIGEICILGQCLSNGNFLWKCIVYFRRNIYCRSRFQWYI